MWHTLRFPQISGNGNWVSYLIDYDESQDTLQVSDSKGKIKFEFPNASMGQFQPNEKPKYFVFKDNRGVGLFNLSTTKTEWDEQATRYEFSKDGRYIAFFNPQTLNGYLKLLDTKTSKTFIINDLQNFKFSPSENSAVVITTDSIKSTISLLTLDNMRQSVILRAQKTQFLFPIWNNMGNGLIFMGRDQKERRRLYFFENKEEPKLKTLDEYDLKSIGKLAIAEAAISISNDGKRIFFLVQESIDTLNELASDTVKVQVWKGSDKWIYPRQKTNWFFNKKEKLAVWWPHSNKVSKIETKEYPESILTEDKKYSLGYHLLTYEPEYRSFPKSDFYITNLETGQKKLLIDSLETGVDYLNLSPNSQHIAYFKNHNWWIYDIIKEKHFNCTEKIAISFSYKFAPQTSEVVPFGFGGWTTRGTFLLYDEFDIWEFDLEGKNPIRLTHGREVGTTYRNYQQLFWGYAGYFSPDQNLAYDLDNELAFITSDSLYNFGYAIKNKSNRIVPLAKGLGKISQLRKAKYSDTYIFIKEDYNKPLALYLHNKKKSLLLFESNKHQKDFKIGKTELISYKNKEGQVLNGILHYPDNFENGKKYPMIVVIYELVSSEIHNYTNPGYFNTTGFNFRNYTAAGYFVLEPDVLIQKGNPGFSAADCVITATNKVIEMGLIDPKKIGLIGHSFGGYETVFIISQSNMFSAAVIGAGIFDIVWGYHTINKNRGRPLQYLYENQQWQMGEPFFKNKYNYYNNSPLYHSPNIKTPTLVWAGNLDYHVNWHQSEALYLALRRMGVPVELLIYENEGHSLSNLDNQKDLTQRIHQWFDQFLKK